MKLLRWLLLLVLATPLMAQNIRWDLPVTTVQAQGGNLLPVYAIPGAGIAFYSCSGSVCTSLATTYISATSGTTCPNSPTPAQVVLNGTSTCVSTADPYGNMGGWFQPGQYMVTITVGSASYNYYFTIGPGGGGAGPYLPLAGGAMNGATFPASAITAGNIAVPTIFTPHGALNVQLFGTTSTAVQTAINTASSLGLSVYFPCATYSLTSALTLASSTRYFGDGSCSILQEQSPYDFNIFNGSNVHDIEIDHLNMQGFVASPDTGWHNMGVYIASPTAVIGNNANINIHDNIFQNLENYGTYIWYTDGLYIRNNRFLNDQAAVQAYDNENGWIEGNFVGGTNATGFVTLIAVVSVSGLAPNGGHPTTVGLHNQNMHVNHNTTQNSSFGEDFLIHDCTNCEVIGNNSWNDRAGYSISEANNFNMVLDGVTVIGNNCVGGEGGNPAILGNFCTLVGGDTTVATWPVWAAMTTYTLPSNNTCTTSPATCVVPTTATGQSRQAIRWMLSAVSTGSTCTSAGSEPTWPAWTPAYLNTPLTMTDGDCTWTALGPWMATATTVSENTSAHNGFQEPLTSTSSYAFYVFGATDGVTESNNNATDCYGACYGVIGPSNLRFKMSNNIATHVVTNTHSSTRTGYIIRGTNPNPATVTGTINSNYVDNAAIGYNWAQTLGDLSKLNAANNFVGPDITSEAIHAGGTGILNPVLGNSCTAGQYATSNVPVTGASTITPWICAQVAPSQLSVGALTNGITATTQTTGDNTADVATDTFANAAAAAAVAAPGPVRTLCSVAPTADAVCAHGNDATIAGVTCANSTDALSATPATFATNCQIPANWLTTNGSLARHLRVVGLFGDWSPATAPGFVVFTLGYGSSGLYTVGNTLATSANLTNQSGSAAWDVIAGTQSGSTSPIAASISSLQVGQATTANIHNGQTQPQTITTNANANIIIKIGWAATGIASGTYTSGGSITGSTSQTCTLSGFNNGNSGGTATVALTGTNTIAGGTALVVTNTGVASTSAATSATLGNGTATCSGTATISTVLGGAQGTALNLQGLIVESN